MKLGMEVVFWAHPPPNFWLMSVVAKRLDGFKMPLGTEVGFGPGDIVLDGDPVPPTLKKITGTGTTPKILAHVCCSQMAGWIKMPLCTEVGIGPGHIVFDGNPARP